jgi:hypothetical protein
MLSRTYEWYRIVNSSPTTQTIDNRKEAIRTVVDTLDEARDLDGALGFAAGVVAGFEMNFTQNSPVVQALVRAIRARESAFPEDLSENALELRACAAVVVGEIIAPGDDQVPKAMALPVAAALRSGLGARPSSAERFLAQVLHELDDVAAKALALAALSRRQPQTELAQRFDNLQEMADLSALSAAWKSFIPALRGAMKEITAQSAIDREEIDVLWWMFGGASITTGKPMAEMAAGAAALCCGAELGSQCLVPPSPAFEAMVRRAYETGRKPDEMSKKSLTSVAADWHGQLASVLVPDEATRALARKYPLLFPLSWLCDRLLSSMGARGWADEFKRMTNMSPSHVLPPASWAVQALRERVACRAYAELIEGGE